MSGTILWINEEARHFGGCETYIFNTVNYLAKRGWKNQLMYNFLSPADEEFTGIFSESYPLVSFEKQVQALKPDLIFINRWTGEELYEKAARQNIPVMKMFHDSTDFCLRNHGMNYFTGRACKHCLGYRCFLDLGFIGRGKGITGLSWNSLSAKKRMLAATRRLDTFLVASNYMVSVLKNHSFAAERIKKIPLFVKSPVDLSNCDDVSSGKDGTPTVLFAGQLIRGKGVDLLIEAMAQTKEEVRCRIVGSGNEEQKLKAQVQRLRLTSRIEFIPRVSQDALGKFYDDAVCAVVPSRAPETFCLVGPEAMSYGTPVVGVDVGGIPEWLDDTNGILVEGYKPELIAQAIDRLVADPQLTKELSTGAAKSYKDRFTIEKYGNSFIFLIDSLIQGKRGEKAA
jgi:glycosyltransferase involved in cell wall biosynthesis